MVFTYSELCRLKVAKEEAYAQLKAAKACENEIIVIDRDCILDGGMFYVDVPQGYDTKRVKSWPYSFHRRNSVFKMFPTLLSTTEAPTEYTGGVFVRKRSEGDVYASDAVGQTFCVKELGWDKTKLSAWRRRAIRRDAKGGIPIKACEDSFDGSFRIDYDLLTVTLCYMPICADFACPYVQDTSIELERRGAAYTDALNAYTKYKVSYDKQCAEDANRAKYNADDAAKEAKKRLNDFYEQESARWGAQAKSDGLVDACRIVFDEIFGGDKKELARRLHPDKGGDLVLFQALMGAAPSRVLAA